MNNEFEKEFESDAEMEEALDSFIRRLAKDIEEDEKGPEITNTTRVSQMQVAFATLKRVTHGQKVTVSYKLNQPYKSMGSITVEGKSIEFCTPGLFTRIASLANSTDIYPLVNGNVRISFTFHGLTNPIKAFGG